MKELELENLDTKTDETNKEEVALNEQKVSNEKRIQGSDVEHDTPETPIEKGDQFKETMHKAIDAMSGEITAPEKVVPAIDNFIDAMDKMCDHEIAKLCGSLARGARDIVVRLQSMIAKHPSSSIIAKVESGLKSLVLDVVKHLIRKAEEGTDDYQEDAEKEVEDKRLKRDFDRALGGHEAVSDLLDRDSKYITFTKD